MKSLPSEALEGRNQGCVYKPIYLASLSGSAHAIGAVLDYDRSNFLFFDSNHGLAGFNDQADMKRWLDRVTNAYYSNTKPAPAST